MIYASITAAAIALSIAGMKMSRFAKKPREWRTMDTPHVYPPNPFESRQVRRARERQEAQRRGSADV